MGYLQGETGLGVRLSTGGDRARGEASYRARGWAFYRGRQG